MYPVNRAEATHHAEVIKQEFGTVYDPLGPFVVFSELIEGAAVHRIAMHLGHVG